MAAVAFASATHVTNTSDDSSLARSGDQSMKNSLLPLVLSSITGASFMPISDRNRGRLSFGV